MFLVIPDLLTRVQLGDFFPSLVFDTKNLNPCAFALSPQGIGLFDDQMAHIKNHRDNKERTLRTATCVLLGIFAALTAMKSYMVMEMLVVLLLLAISTVTILASVVALILCQAGLLWAILSMKTGVTRLARLAGLSPEAPDLAEQMSHAKD